MVRLSLAAIAASLAPLAAGQVAQPSALPDVTAPSGMVCAGCYVVAEVAGIVFGGVTTTTQTAVVSVGSNGSVVTTSIVDGAGVITYASDGPVGAPPVSYNTLDSVITLSGAILTSPTQYEVFTAYSVVSTVSGPNGCSLSSESRVALGSAYEYRVPENAGTDYLLQIESMFISSIGYPECAAGGGMVQTTTQSMIATTTTSVTSRGLQRPTPIPAISGVASSTAASYQFPSITPAGTGGFTGGSAGPSVTITPASNAAARPTLSLPIAGVIAAVGAFAWWF